MLRFTIRDLFWLTLVVGLVVGWWVDRERLAEHVEEAQIEVQLLEGGRRY